MKGTRKKKRQCGHFTGETGRKGFGFRKNLQQNLGKSTGTKITALVKKPVAIMETVKNVSQSTGHIRNMFRIV